MSPELKRYPPRILTPGTELDLPISAQKLCMILGINFEVLYTWQTSRVMAPMPSELGHRYGSKNFEAWELQQLLVYMQDELKSTKKSNYEWLSKIDFQRGYSAVTNSGYIVTNYPEAPSQESIKAMQEKLYPDLRRRQGILHEIQQLNNGSVLKSALENPEAHPLQRTVSKGLRTESGLVLMSDFTGENNVVYVKQGISYGVFHPDKDMIHVYFPINTVQIAEIFNTGKLLGDISPIQFREHIEQVVEAKQRVGEHKVAV